VTERIARPLRVGRAAKDAIIVNIKVCSGPKIELKIEIEGLQGGFEEFCEVAPGGEVIVMFLSYDAVGRPCRAHRCELRTCRFLGGIGR
jgi:hypothetical protein